MALKLISLLAEVIQIRAAHFSFCGHIKHFYKKLARGCYT